MFININCFSQQIGARGKKETIALNVANEKGRNLILAGKINEAIASYAQLAQNSTNNTLIAEYAYALALGGIYDAALINLDRIESSYNETDVDYFTSQIYILMGYDDIAAEFWKLSDNIKTPSWIALNANTLSEKYKCKHTGHNKISREKLIAKFKSANEQLTNHLYLESIVQFHDIIDILPNEYLPYAGYSVALEKIGALEKSEQVLEKAISLVGNNQENLSKKQFLQTRLAAVRAKITTTQKVRNEFQKNVINDKAPQMMAYAGTVIGPSSFNINGKIGYFIVNSINASFNFGLTSADGSTSKNLGLSVYDRSHAFVYGLGFQNYASTWSIVYTLGVSIKFKKNKNRSFDIFLDFDKGLSSNSTATTNITFGIPFYFGKRK